MNREGQHRVGQALLNNGVIRGPKFSVAEGSQQLRRVISICPSLAYTAESSAANSADLTGLSLRGIEHGLLCVPRLAVIRGFVFPRSWRGEYTCRASFLRGNGLIGAATGGV